MQDELHYLHSSPNRLLSPAAGAGENTNAQSFDGETCVKQLEELRHRWKDNTKTDKYIG
jgi:hypothetical protein